MRKDFKVGDLVERITDSYGDIKLGERYIVTHITKLKSGIKLKNHDGLLSYNKFKLIQKRLYQIW